MKKGFLCMAAAGVLVSASGIALAQQGRIQQREENQQQRIGEGVESGTLSPKETAHLENQQANLNREIRHDRNQNGGNLTNKEKAQINRQQNRLSGNIYRAKHDGPHR